MHNKSRSQVHASQQQKQKLNREQNPELTQLAMASKISSQLRAYGHNSQLRVDQLAIASKHGLVFCFLS
jgi:hypothetical protein